jgi:ATP-dependent helicase HrpA
MIGHTQPRRLAARTVSARIAEELGVQLGTEVGYAVRFDERVSAETSVKLMTDGILLTEIQRDHQLRRYDTIIVDEAHERTLNVDFLLGYLKRLLPRRPDLKLVITSATIDPERFSAHFGGAPIIEVSGRTYPVEVRYRTVVDMESTVDPDPDRDTISAITAAIDELGREGRGDMLVFLSGEREIRDAADAVRGHTRRWREPVEVLPLYSRLPTADQQRVFADHTTRRIVLATNVAETSLTVPGIHYVIDPGTARISRYNTRTKVQRLPIEPISQASANQRAGRCGRVADGICIRLYSEADLASRSEFTQPEILRTNLASVILQMAALRLGDVADFPFLDPPDRRQITDGRTVLTELGALDGDRLTGVGRQLAQLPIDPRLARMIVAGAAAGCLREVLVIAAGLAIQDPRERPVDQQPAADAKHRRFTDPTSDFMSMLALWRYVRDQQKALSGNAFRRLCRTDFLNYLRVREWQDVESQLRQTAKALGMPRGPATDDADAIHRALLAGLLAHVGAYDDRTRDYQGARGSRFVIFPGSALARRRPDWVVAAELVETSRLFARVCAQIDPAWVEQAAGNLVRRSYSEPRWSKRRGSVVATERVTLFGLPLITDRTVGYGRIDPELSRELFIRHALVEGDWETRHQFFHDNASAMAAAEELEERSRQRGLAADDEALFAFYDARIPTDVVSTRHFDAWWKKAQRDGPDLLRFTPKPVAAEAEIDDDFPASWPWAGADLRLSYVFDPADSRDGVTVHVPLAVLAALPAAPFEWQVPGLRDELVTAMIRSLPKPVRRRLVPAPDLARAFLAGPGRTGPDAGPLTDLLASTLADWRGVSIRPGDWQLESLPAHLRMTFVVQDDDGAVRAEGKDLDVLRQQLSAAALAEVSADFQPLRGRTSWDFGDLPEVYETERGGHRVRAYPALVDEGTSVALRLVAGPAEQRVANHDGVRRLLLLAVPAPMNAAVRALTSAERMALRVTPHGSAAELLDDCLAAAADAVMDGGPLPKDAASFDALLARTRLELPSTATRVLRDVATALAAYGEARLAVDRVQASAAAEDMDAQLGRLVHPGFVTGTTARRLPDLARYLRAITIRAGQPSARDAELTARAQLLEHDYADVVQSLPPDRRTDPDVVQVRWLVEELRVSFFAQRLGTRVPVSEKRVQRAIDAL